MLNIYIWNSKEMNNKSKNPVQWKTTLKWNNDGELSSIDMARIIDVLCVSELKECELTCTRVNKDKNSLNLGDWW